MRYKAGRECSPRTWRWSARQRYADYPVKVLSTHVEVVNQLDGGRNRTRALRTFGTDLFYFVGRGQVAAVFENDDAAQLLHGPQRRDVAVGAREGKFEEG